MKTNDQIRLENLEIAIQRMGGVAARLAAAADLAPAYLSQIRTGSTDTKYRKVRKLGFEAARKIESALGEPPGWMDVDHSGQAQIAVTNTAWPFTVSPKDFGLLTTAELSALNAVVKNFIAGCVATRNRNAPADALGYAPDDSR